MARGTSPGIGPSLASKLPREPPHVLSSPADRIIVALDGMAPEQALAFAAAVPTLRWVKVGLELFVAAGPLVV